MCQTRGTEVDVSEQTTKTTSAAKALSDLYGTGVHFLASVIQAGWMTEAERAYFSPLAEALRKETK